MFRKHSRPSETMGPCSCIASVERDRWDGKNVLYALHSCLPHTEEMSAVHVKHTFLVQFELPPPYVGPPQYTNFHHSYDRLLSIEVSVLQSGCSILIFRRIPVVHTVLAVVSFYYMSNCCELLCSFIYSG